MKTIKCSQVGGGECSFEATGETVDEAREALGNHAKEAHAEMIASITPEAVKEWNTMLDKLWEETPEDTKE